MEDRLVQYPNRVRLVQVDGQPGVYDIEAVPGAVTANGTPLNKATLLSDTVATLVNNAATPNEALKYLAERVQPVRLGGTGASTVEGILANLDIDDYVVGQGTSGNWTYRKWNSGIAECWGIHNPSSSASGTEGGLYFQGIYIDFPSGLFASAPRTLVTAHGNWIGGAMTGNGLTAAKWEGYRWTPTSQTNTGALKIELYCIGTWK